MPGLSGQAARMDGEKQPGPTPWTEEERRDNERAILAHAVPFVAWVFLMGLLGDPAGWKYAVRAGASLGLFLWLKPWKHAAYAPLRLRNLPWAVVIGVAVFVIWVIGEAPWVEANLPWLHRAYLFIALLPPWKITETEPNLVYAPDVAGWWFTSTRMLGSAFVISFVEEFFWRGWLYRWLQARRWRHLDPGIWSASTFLWVALFFGLQHREWVAGVICGLLYGWLAIVRRDVWAAGIAHAITNLLLALYVIVAGAYQFWV